MRCGGHVAWPLASFLVAIVLLAPVLTAQAQFDDDDELPQYLPGLVAEYSDSAGASVQRIDKTLAFDWTQRPPDVRLSQGPFSAQWRGRLFTIVPGTYRLQVFARGDVEIRLAGQTILSAAADEASWLEAQSIELGYGYHPLDVTFRGNREAPRFGLYWEGPQFELEPVSAQWLFHNPEIEVDRRFEEGRDLVRALNCTACHELPGSSLRLGAPALDRTAGNIHPSWIARRLTERWADEDVADDAPVAAGATQRMPHFGLSEHDAKAVAAYLCATPDGDADRRNPEKPDKPPSGDAAAGQRLFVTVGCLACHRAGEHGTDSLWGGGDLSHVAEKRPVDFFSRWLAGPGEINRDHRMPDFGDRLTTAEERAHLAAYLAGLGDEPSGSDETVAKRDEPSTALIERGRELARIHRCHQCHAMPDPDLDRATVPLPDQIDWQRSCAGRFDHQRDRPDYGLTSDQVAAIHHYWSAMRACQLDRDEPIDGQWVWTSNNCRGCHARDLEEGIALHLPGLAAEHADLGPLLPAMTPPSLSGVGDKLHDGEIESAVRGTGPRRRPWLSVRMPRFEQMAEGEAAALVAHLITADRIPMRERANIPNNDDAAMVAAGSRLVSSSGFGCTSCHAIGDSVPTNVALNAQGTDLSQINGRIRRAWFDRWVRNPARIVPRMEMPSIKQPVHGVLGDELDAQLAAVWHVLSLPDFSPPPPNPIRVVRAGNHDDDGEPASVLTDVLEWDGRVWIKPLLIGLPNRHNVLFDLESYRLAGWWLGDTALQRTRGKTWYWEPGGSHLLAATDGAAELALVDRDGVAHRPVVHGQFISEFDCFEKVPHGVNFGTRLRFHLDGEGEHADRDDETIVHVVHTITAAPAVTIDGTPSGFRRRIEIRGVPDGYSIRWRPVGDQELIGDSHTSEADRAVSFNAALGTVTLALSAPDAARLDREDHTVIRLTPDDDGTATAEVFFVSDVPADRFLAPPVEIASAPIVPLDTVPGFDAVQLPLPREVMPTALAWREDGTLIVASLKGRVWLAHDSDGDGLEDRLTLYSDDLAAPYGVAAHGDAIDVINKYALLRLIDADGDGRAERTEVLCSGWGHTDDYHDWAIGLPRDEDGNYYVTLPCQQDNRAPAAAALRGTAIKLIPREPTRDNPQRYRIEEICAGLRFPNGVALSRSGDLFATDNQGNYKPFNELNHLLPGERYGFINKLEAKPGFRPPRREPAVNIPHPWTRSVNGIAFLDTPPAVRRRLGRDVFGPFEGHVIGCEYNERMLVRISLEPADDSFQGAVYPFSLPVPDDAPTFEGPLVCQVAPDGGIYVGSIHDSGWGGGANTGSIVRLTPRGEWPPGIAEMRAAPDGFVLEFTAPIEISAASDIGNYTLSSYRRESTPAYGGSDLDRHTETITAVEVAPNGRHVKLVVDHLREGYVYELRLGNLSTADQPLHPAEAHYTLHHLPR